MMIISTVKQRVKARAIFCVNPIRIFQIKLTGITRTVVKLIYVVGKSLHYLLNKSPTVLSTICEIKNLSPRLSA